MEKQRSCKGSKSLGMSDTNAKDVIKIYLLDSKKIQLTLISQN